MGGQHRLAAYLWFQKDVGDSFTMIELREALGDGDRLESAEHLNRRLRELRDFGWIHDSYKDRQGQAPDTYILRQKGDRTWLGEGRKRDVVSAKMRRMVLDRDGRRCVVCGVGADETYPGETAVARLTVGHRKAGARLADASPDNLQAECGRCNEPSGDEIPDPEALGAVMATLRRFRAKDRAELLTWVEGGRRQRSLLDLAYDRVRKLSTSERETVRAWLHQSLATDDSSQA